MLPLPSVRKHVDDFVVVSSSPEKIIKDLEEYYEVTGKEEPKFHLGTSINKLNNKSFVVMSAHISTSQISFLL